MPDTPEIDAAEVLSVSAAIELAQDALALAPGRIWLEGEVLGFKGAHQSGHYYFTLKDSGASLSIKMWRSVVARGMRCPLSEGKRVKIRGAFDIYATRGSLSFTAEIIEDAGGEGELYRRYVELGKRLRAEGAFEREFPIPERPQKVVVICGAGSAAEADIFESFHSHGVPMQIYKLPCLVQGPAATPALVRALHDAASIRPDVILLSRGGGSMEDLWGFNEEDVVRAIVECPAPVLCAIGHESDHTLAELAADRRAKTPTAAAEILCAGWVRVREDCADWAFRIERALLQQLEHEQLQLSALRSHLAAQAPHRRLERARSAMHSCELRMSNAMQEPIQAGLHRCTALAGRLNAGSPLGLLNRGYALVEKPGGGYLRNPKEVTSGDSLRVHLSQGEMQVTVE
ncbi:MAG: exodeoxyribonuclease VII large subunit [Planctomycetes bacterium]|nr:exodeoxyribonuclease VII large subunit [Planctomycetota bacterium]